MYSQDFHNGYPIDHQTVRQYPELDVVRIVTHPSERVLSTFESWSNVRFFQVYGDEAVAIFRYRAGDC